MLGALIFGLALRVLENFRVEERIVSIRCFVEKLGALRMKLESILEKLESVIDLYLLCGIDLLVDVLFGLEVQSCKRRLLGRRGSPQY